MQPDRSAATKRRRLTIGTATLATAGAITYAVVALTTGTTGLTFQGTFENGLTPWKTAGSGGGAQCANTGVPSGGTHYRGTLGYDKTNPGQGATGGRFTLAAQSAYPLEVCDIITGQLPNSYPSDAYYGLMVRVPVGFNPGGFGDAIYGLHFVNVWSAPINLVAWNNRIEVNLQTGACNPVGSAAPGCQYRKATGYPPKTIVPVGSFAGGGWYELVTRVRWAIDKTGLIQTWWRKKGGTTWNPGAAAWSGIPTEQWYSGRAIPATYDDEIASYTAKQSTPLTVWLDNEVAGPSFAAVAATMP